MRSHIFKINDTNQIFLTLQITIINVVKNLASRCMFFAETHTTKMTQSRNLTVTSSRKTIIKCLTADKRHCIGAAQGTIGVVYVLLKAV